MKTTKRAIARSVSHTEIVTLEYNWETIQDLLVWSDDNVETETVHEFWGTDDDGNEWRVHVRREEAAS